MKSRTSDKMYNTHTTTTLLLTQMLPLSLPTNELAVIFYEFARACCVPAVEVHLQSLPQLNVDRSKPSNKEVTHQRFSGSFLLLCIIFIWFLIISISLMVRYDKMVIVFT